MEVWRCRLGLFLLFCNVLLSNSQWINGRPFWSKAFGAIGQLIGVESESPKSIHESGFSQSQPPFDDRSTEEESSLGCDQVPFIKNKSDLQQLDREALRCLFVSGVTPKNIPLGFAYGEVLDVVLSRTMTRIAGDIWGGKIMMKMWCNKRKTDFRFVLNLVAGTAKFPAKVYIGENRFQVAPNDVLDRRPSMWIDYTGEFKDCQSEDPTANQEMTSEFMANIYPINQILDEVRLVGSDDSTGADIFLGRALFPVLGAYRTIAWWSMTVFDTQHHYGFQGHPHPRTSPLPYRRPHRSLSGENQDVIFEEERDEDETILRCFEEAEIDVLEEESPGTE